MANTNTDRINCSNCNNEADARVIEARKEFYEDTFPMCTQCSIWDEEQMDKTDKDEEDGPNEYRVRSYLLRTSFQAYYMAENGIEAKKQHEERFGKADLTFLVRT